MICKNCKTEFPDDKVYCPKCGTPVQVVPDYNVLDEEVLSSYLKRFYQHLANACDIYILKLSGNEVDIYFDFHVYILYSWDRIISCLSRLGEMLIK